MRRATHQTTANTNGPPADSRGHAVLPPALLAALLIVASVGLWVSLREDAAGVSPLHKAAHLPGAGIASFDPLVGSWVRDDGEYTLSVRQVRADGLIDARYFNPGPVHVALARASHENGPLRLYVEMRDEGYPGSHYRLLYEPAGDVLLGTYFQALAGETYQVGFHRVRDRR